MTTFAPLRRLLTPLALGATLLAAGTAQATITVYTSEASFLAAITAPVTDSFDDLLPGTGYDSPLLRRSGAYSYSVSSGPDSPRLYGAGSASDAWLSTNIATDTITFTFSGVAAAGGYFFGSDIDGAFLRRGNIVVGASDSNDSASLSVNRALQSNFIGFVSDNVLSTLTVTASTRFPRFSGVWPTVDDLTLASPVPEPETAAMLLSGLAVLGFLARRRRAD